MRDRFDPRIWKVGLTVIGGIILFYLGIMWAQRSDLFEPEQKAYTVMFDNVNGLLVGDPVTVRGFVSGRVLDIIPDNEAVTVRISMDERIQLRRDARAEIQIRELMGGKQVAVHPGLAEERLESGATFPGIASLDFSSSFSEFGAVIEQVNVNQVNQLLSRLDTFAGSLNEMADAMPTAQLEVMVNRFERIAAQLEKGMNDLDAADWLNRLDQILQKAEGTLVSTDSALSKILVLSEDLTEEDIQAALNMFREAEASLTQVNSMVDRVDHLLDTLSSDETLAGQLLTQRSFRDQIDSTLIRLNRVLDQIYEKRIIVGLKRKKSERP